MRQRFKYRIQQYFWNLILYCTVQVCKHDNYSLSVPKAERRQWRKAGHFTDIKTNNPPTLHTFESLHSSTTQRLLRLKKAISSLIQTPPLKATSRLCSLEKCLWLYRPRAARQPRLRCWPFGVPAKAVPQSFDNIFFFQKPNSGFSRKYQQNKQPVLCTSAAAICLEDFLCLN